MHTPKIHRHTAFNVFALAAFALVVGACATQPSPSSTPAAVSAAPAVSSPATPVPVTPAPAPAAMATPAPVVAPMATVSAPIAVNGAVDFDSQIKPFLAEYCVRCHGGNAGRPPSGGVNLTHQDGLQFAAKDNLMYEMLVSEGSDHMPPRNQTQPEDAERAMIKQWILEGAKLPADYPAGSPGAN